MRSVVRHLPSHGASWRGIYLQGIDNAEIIQTVHARRDPMIPVTTSRAALPGTPR
jgi:hypothetical protein